MIKVLHVYKSFGSDSFGGVETFIESLVESTKLECRHIILALGPVKSISVKRYRGAIVVLVKPQFTGLSMPVSLVMIPIFWVLSRRVDVVHYHYPFPLQDLLSFFSKSSLPSVVTYHSDIVRQRITGFLYQPLMRFFLNRADEVVATSPVYKATSNVLRSLKKIPSVVPLSIPALDLNADKSRLDYWQQRVGENFQLFLGAHRAYKGLPGLVAAAANTKLPLVIAGEGEITEKIVRQAEMLGASNIHFVGFVSEEDKVALLFLCSALVLPSCQRSEAFGIVLLEAARQFRPMITTELGTATSWVNQQANTGLVVNPNNQSQLEKALIFMHQHPGIAQKMGTLAGYRFETMFDITLMAKKYINIYQKVIFDKKLAGHGSGTAAKKRLISRANSQ